jgi:zinc transport system permease protein
MDHWLDNLIYDLAAQFPAGTFFAQGFNLSALLALLFVALACGATGPLVVSGRMAFFSDALAHSAFAGISIGFVIFTGLPYIFPSLPIQQDADTFWNWVTPIMVAFGMGIGFAIAWVRERTSLSSDTVIGVFFASAVGLAATLRKIMNDRRLFTLEDFLFGDPLLVRGNDLVLLGLLVVLTAGMLWWVYNPLLLGGFNSSLALSRRVPHQLASYAFVVLLAIIVNLSVRTVGILLINALLVVPAAAAVNVSRNLRQVFWLSLLFTIGCSLLGLFLSWEVETRTRLKLGIPGAVVLSAALLFAITVAVRPLLMRTPTGASDVSTG